MAVQLWVVDDSKTFLLMFYFTCNHVSSTCQNISKKCFRVVRPCRCPCVRPSVRDSRGSFMFSRYLQYLLTDFAKLLSLVHLRTEMNWLDFGVKRSKDKVTAWPNASQIFMFPLYLQYLYIDFRQTFVAGASWDTDDLITFLCQKVICKATPSRRSLQMF